jgi:hypothetical protein
MISGGMENRKVAITTTYYKLSAIDKIEKIYDTIK